MARRSLKGAHARQGGRVEARRREWVTLSCGDLCVWALSPDELTQLTLRWVREYARDPAALPALFIQASAYDGDDRHARRLFANLTPIAHLKPVDLAALLAVMGRLNDNALLVRQIEQQLSRGFRPQ